jgi:hypothetical protein
MDTRNGLVTFGLFVLLFAFTFVFSTVALGEDNVAYGILALIGFLVCIGASVFNSVLAAQEGAIFAVWFRTYAILVGIIFVWFLTRVGTAFGWW